MCSIFGEISYKILENAEWLKKASIITHHMKIWDWKIFLEFL